MEGLHTQKKGVNHFFRFLCDDMLDRYIKISCQFCIFQVLSRLGFENNAKNVLFGAATTIPAHGGLIDFIVDGIAAVGFSENIDEPDCSWKLK